MTSNCTEGQLISDDEVEDIEADEDAVNRSSSDSNDAEEIEPTNREKLRELNHTSRFISTDDASNNWWEKLLEDVPEDQQCKTANCTLAPPGHKIHPYIPSLRRNPYTLFETRLIIQYLIKYDEIEHGKGHRVWDMMHIRGYLKHRTGQSLNNYFKKNLLRDIKNYGLPKDIEDQFLKLKS